MELLRQPLMDMERVKQLFQRLGKWEYFWLCLMVVVTLALHFALITQPNEPIFDEQHYVPDARLIIQGEGSLRTEHPPLGKLFIVSGIRLFGDNPLGWRFFSVVFGTICLVLFYFICRELNLSRKAASLATFLLSLENLTFIQASVAMLDVYNLAFMLLCFWLYLKGKYLLSGVSAALSALVKLTGVLVLPVIGLHWLLARRDRPAYFVGAMLLAGASFVLLLPLFNYPIFHQFLNPIDNIKTMVSLSSSLTFTTVTHLARSRPWEWIFMPLIMSYWYQPHYLGAISFNIWALIIPSLAYMAWLVWKGKKLNVALFTLSWFAGTYLIWIPLSLITNRISYVYYFYPTIGAICIALGLGLSQLLDLRATSTGKVRRIATWSTVGYLALHVIIFAVLWPLSTWWSIS